MSKSKVKVVETAADTMVKRPRGRPPGAGARTVTFGGKTQTLREWSAELGIGYQTLYQRLNKGEPANNAQKAMRTKKAFLLPRYARSMPKKEMATQV